MSDYLVRVKTTAASAVTQGIAAEIWDIASPHASLIELHNFFGRIRGSTLPGIVSVEVQQNDIQGASPQILQPGTVPVPTSGQPAVGWVIVATAGNTVLTVGPAANNITQAFITSQAVTAAALVGIINQSTAGMGAWVTAALDPAGVAGKVILTMKTLPWDHIIGGAVNLSVTGTGTSVSGATFNATNTFPARTPVNAPNNAISL
jgi:hypothetical protein